MRKASTTIKLAVVTALLLLATSGIRGQSQEVIYKAMQDELDRSMSQLVMEGLERPYFISYTIDDYQSLSVTASLGTLLRSNLDRGRYLTVDVRVGNDSLDNSNFVSGWSDMTPSYHQLAIDNDYDAIRNMVYLTTDNAYKEVLKTLSEKKAYLQSRVVTSRPPDFIMLPQNRYQGKLQKFDADQAAAEAMLRGASEVLRGYPMIVSSELRAEIGIANQYFVNSLGSKTLRGDRTCQVELSMSGKNADGEDVSYSDRIIAGSVSDLPDKSGLTKWTRQSAEVMKSLVEADTIEEYIGPVILSGDAAGEFFRQLFAKNISNVPSPIYEDERFASMMSSPEFANKINRRVLPAFFDVYDDPTISEFQGLKLVGHYSVDDVGGVPSRVKLVEKGKLKSLLIGVAPTRKVSEPNGHARGAVSKQVTAKPANLIFESSDQVPYEDLKRSMLELCQDADLEYGLVIKKIRDMNDPGGRPGFSMFGMSRGSESGLTTPLAVYKLYPDGREVPVRGLDFANITVRLLKDILQTDDQEHVYNYLVGGDYEMPVSIVCPSILLEEVELKQGEAKTQKPPILPSPLAEQ